MTARLAACFLFLYVIIVPADGSLAAVTTTNGSITKDRAHVIERNYFDSSPKSTLINEPSYTTGGDGNGQGRSDSDKETSPKTDIIGLVRNKLPKETNHEVHTTSVGETEKRLLLEDSGISTNSGSHVAAGTQASRPNATNEDYGETNTTDKFTVTETTWPKTPTVAPPESDLVFGNISASTAISGTLEYFELNPEIGQKILDGLDGIIVDLEDLHGMYKDYNSFSNLSVKMNLPKRFVRSALPPTKSRRECRVTLDQLRDLNRDIGKTFGSFSSLSSKPTQCTLDENNTDNCDEWVTNLQCGMHHLKKGFEQAREDKVSLSEVTSLRKDYDRLNAKIIKQADDIRADVSKEYQGKIDKLKTDLQDLQRQVNSLKSELELIKSKLRRKEAASCAKSIQLGKLKEALEEFKEMGDDSLLQEIVTQAYTGDSTHLPNVTAFLKKLPNCQQIDIASAVVFEQMKAHGHLESPQIFSFSKAIHYCSSLNYPDLKTLMTKLERPKNATMVDWGVEIRSRNWKDITAYAEKYHEDFVVYVEQVIQTAFSGNIENAETVIDFIDALPYPEQQVVGYPSLFDVMTRSNGLEGYQLIMLAYRCKQRMENVGIASAAEKQRLENIKGRLPGGVRSLLWERSVYIQSKSFKYYASFLMSDKSYYKKFVACEAREGGFDRYKWTVTQREKGRYFRFYDKNQECGLIWGYSCLKAIGSAWINWNEWEVIPIRNGEAFHLKRVEDQRFLSVADKSGWSKFWSAVPRCCDDLQMNDSRDYDLGLWSIS